MLKKARQDLSSGRNDSARNSLSRIVQQYPRTDAAAAATVALVMIAHQEREKLEGDLATLRMEHDRQKTTVQGLQKTVDEIRRRPAQVIVQAPPKPAAKKVTPKKPTAKKKTTPKKKTTTRRKR
jgi:predicted  nucleic acid-binding Zn-ribbon protein